jgi:hypothetical protein
VTAPPARGRRAAVACLAVAACAPAPAGAGEAAAPVEIVAAIPPEAGGAAGAVLIGRAGQIYQPVAPGRWQRRAAGGVAIDLRAAVRARPRTDEVIAVGESTPLYRFASGAWRAEPLTNRGPAALSTTGLAALAVGRHVYTLDPATGAWQRRASAARQVTAAWAASPTYVVVATADGGIARWEGRRFAPVRSPLPAGTALAALVGASPSALYGRAGTGAWLRIDRASAALLSPARELAGFEEHASGVGPDGRLWLAGTVPATDGARRAVLARADRDQILPAGDLAPLAPGDRLAVLVGAPASGELLVATRAGAVRMRDKKGTWSEGAASAALPPAPTRPGAVSRAPARTR